MFLYCDDPVIDVFSTLCLPLHQHHYLSFAKTNPGIFECVRSEWNPSSSLVSPESFDDRAYALGDVRRIHWARAKLQLIAPPPVTSREATGLMNKFAQRPAIAFALNWQWVDLMVKATPVKAANATLFTGPTARLSITRLKVDDHDLPWIAELIIAPTMQPTLSRVADQVTTF
jgi:hypothetical protein